MNRGEREVQDVEREVDGERVWVRVILATPVRRRALCACVWADVRTLRFQSADRKPGAANSYTKKKQQQTHQRQR